MTQDRECNPDLNAVADYFNGWERYQLVIKYNYMEHIEIERSIAQYLSARSLQPCSFLDLGCGDASFSARLFRHFPISSYTGVDLSATALDLARRHLNRLAAKIDLQQQELLAFLTNSSDRYDVILSSFSVHHLSSARKQAYLQLVRQHLQPNGVLLLVDVFRQEDETLQEYIDRYRYNIHTYWTQLSPEVQASLIQHIIDSDYPEWESSVRSWSQTAGFQDVSLLYSGGRDTQKLLAIS